MSRLVDLALLVACAVFYGVLIVLVPAAADFSTFWVAGKLALAGDAAAAYDWPRFAALKPVLTGDPALQAVPWRNPPVFLLFLMPLALLDYPVAWCLWQVLSLAALAASIRTIPQGLRQTMLVALAPAALTCAALGQNGFFTAALLASAMALLDRRPVAAGIAIALLACKPQFGLIFPALLALNGRWTAFSAAAVGTLILVALSLVAFGPGLWVDFLGSLRESSIDLVAPGQGAFVVNYASMRALALKLGFSGNAAWAIHAGVAAAAFGVALWTLGRAGHRAPQLRAPAGIAAAMLATPYVVIYDQVVLAVAALFIARSAGRTGWLPAEQVLIVAACLLPALLFVGVTVPMEPVSWLVILGLVVWRMARSTREPAMAAGPDAPWTTG